MIITEKIVDLKTNKETIIEREATAEEIAAFDKVKAEAEAAAKAEAEAAEKRQALLDKLGITADEAKLLLG